MSRRLYCTGILLAAAVALTALPSAEVLAQKKAKAKQAKAPVDSDKLAGSEYAGTLKSTPGTDRMFTLDVEQDTLVATGNGSRVGTNNRPRRAPNPNRINQSINRIQQAMQRGQQAEYQLASAKNAGARNKAQQAINKAQNDVNKAQLEYQNALAQYIVQASAQANAAIVTAIRRAGTGIPSGYKLVKAVIPIEFQATETVKVRTLVLPDQFDEKGNPMKYTKAQLAELKGKDNTLPGYESSIDKLQAGQKLRVTLAAAAKPKKAADKDVDKDAALDPEGEKKKQVKLVVILAESTGDTAAAKVGKKAKK